MSHVATVEIKFRNLNSLATVLKGQNIEYKLGEQTVTMYEGKKQCSMSFKLPGWTYPVIVSEDGTALYDNYNGCWGNVDELHKVTRKYTEEISVNELVRQGFSIQQTVTNEDGSVELVLGRYT